MTAALPTAIKFCSLSEELNDDEFGRLLSAICARTGRKLLLTALFEQFRDEDNANGVESAIADIHDIMSSREPKHQVTQCKSLGVHALPTELIGEIGSYLKQREYFYFGRVFRATYIGCSTPCTLRHLDLLDFDNYSWIRLHKFPQIRSLCFDLNLFDGFQFPSTGTVCTHLNKLLLSGEASSDIDIDQFASATSIDFKAITHLTLKTFGDDDEGAEFAFETLLRLFSRFEGSLQFIKLRNVFVLEMDTAQRAQLSHLLPNVIGLHIDGDLACYESYRIELLLKWHYICTRYSISQITGINGDLRILGR